MHIHKPIAGLYYNFEQPLQVLAATLLAATSKKSPLKVWIRVKGFTKDLDRCLLI
ncbi:hypothetical protein Hdeb2414_s0009g00301381 [Helianthus debilis subsp. tardiflorus]